MNKARKFKLTSRLTICLSRSPSWFLKAWISAVAGFSLGSRALITYETEKKGVQSYSLVSNTRTPRQSPLTLRAFSRYNLYLSSMAFMSSSFFFRAAISSSTFTAAGEQDSPLSHCSTVLIRTKPQLTLFDRYVATTNIHVWELSCWRSSSSSFFFRISSWASFSWTLQEQTLVTYRPLLLL